MVLVVAEQDVVAGPVPFDEIVLEGQGLHLAVGHHQVEVGDLGDQQLQARIARPAGLEVGADAVAQSASLAHVKRLARGVLEEVHAGPDGQALDLLAKGRHGLLGAAKPTVAGSASTVNRHDAPSCRRRCVLRWVTRRGPGVRWYTPLRFGSSKPHAHGEDRRGSGAPARLRRPGVRSHQPRCPHHHRPGAERCRLRVLRLLRGQGLPGARPAPGRGAGGPGGQHLRHAGRPRRSPARSAPTSTRPWTATPTWCSTWAS
jgi:hypothetical protein